MLQRVARVEQHGQVHAVVLLLSRLFRLFHVGKMVDLQAAAGRNKVERELGFPCDHTEILYAEGSECYIGDIKNVDGKYHFRTVAIENIPHTTTRMMHVLAWSYLRRFEKDLETQEIIERYDI